MADEQLEIDEILIDPLEHMLVQVGRGIAESQLEMDKNSLATQEMIDNDKTLSESGITAPWYHYPEVNVDLKMDLSMHSVTQTQQNSGNLVRKYRLYAAPMNAAYCNTFNRDVSGSSSLKLKIVSVPSPPR